MLTNAARWSLDRGNAPVPSRWQATLAFVALAGDEIAGWGFREIRRDGRDQVLLYQLDTAPSWRRQGIGSALVHTVIAPGTSGGVRPRLVVTNKANAAAVAVYTRLDGQAHQDDDVVYRWTLT